MSKKRESRQPVIVSTMPTHFADDSHDSYMVVDLRQIIMQFGGSPYAFVIRRVTNSDKGVDNVMVVDMLFEQSAITTKTGREIAQKLNSWWKPKKEKGN